MPLGKAPTALSGIKNYIVYNNICSSAYDDKKQQKVAIKKVFKVFEHDREFQKRILREVKILKHFNHDNVYSIRFFNFFLDYKFERFDSSQEWKGI